jgi:hypothetical protein
MLLVLKIPVVYLAVVVWWAVRAEPAPEDGSEGGGALFPLTPCGWDDWKRRRAGTGRHRPAGPGGRPHLVRGRRSHARSA